MKIGVTTLLILLSLTSAGQYETRLVAPDSSAFDQFGVTVSIYGEYAVVGAIRQDNDTLTSGATYIYKYHDSTWVFEQKLQPAGHPLWFFYGMVSIYDTTLMVGAMGVPFGKVYVYALRDSIWVQKQIIIPNDKDSTNLFGYHISSWGKNAIVSALDDDTNGVRSGAAYIYEYNGTKWIEINKVIASDGAAQDQFGFSAGIFDSIAVVGAPRNDNSNGVRAGSAYLFKKIGNQWIETQKIIANDGIGSDGFGTSVSIFGKDIIVGSFNNGPTGAAYHFEIDNSMAIQKQKLVTSYPGTSSRYGFWNQIWDQGIAVGAYGDHQGATNGGAVYLLTQVDTVWQEQTKLIASDAENEDELGRHLDMCGNTIIAGADNNPNVQRHGKAYIFELCGFPVITPYSDLKLCQGDTITLKAGCPSDSVNWYNTSGGLLINSRFLDYQPPSTEIVIAEVYSTDTLSGYDTVELEVFPYPVADFTSDTVCEGSPTTFIDISTTIPGSNYWWDFDGDGNADDNVVGNATYTYQDAGPYTAKLKITNEAGCKDIVTKDVVVEECTGIDPIEQSVEFEIYPNPTNGIFEIRFQSDKVLGQVQIDIYNILGKKIYSSSTDVGTSHTESLVLDIVSGLYVVTLTAENLNATRKLILH